MWVLGCTSARVFVAPQLFRLSFCTLHLCSAFRCDLDAEGVTQAAAAAAVTMETTPANNNNVANQEELKLLARLEAANR